jgi:hypothetical protein
MLIYWYRVIGPVTGDILYTEWMFSAQTLRERVTEWTTNGMIVETWCNYLHAYDDGEETS